MSNFMKIRPLEFELFHADEKRDKRKLTVTLRNFANAPKNLRILSTDLHEVFICSA